MVPEFRTFIPEDQVAAYRRSVSRIPGARIIGEGLKVDEFSERIAGVLGNLNPEEVRVIDLDLSKNQWAQRVRKQSGLIPQTPLEWQEFYNSLDFREITQLGQVFRPIIEQGLAGLSLTQLKNRVLIVGINRSRTSIILAEKIFGLKFDSGQQSS